MRMSAAAIRMTTVAMSTNVAVLIPVTAGLMHEVERMNNVYVGVSRLHVDECKRIY